MAIMDARLEFSDNQDVASGSPSSGSTVNSTNVVDLRGSATYDTDYWADNITPDVGESGGLVWNVEVANEAMTGAGTLAVTLQHSNALSSSHLSSGATLATLSFPATSAIGTRRSVRVPAGTINRYLEVVYTVGTGQLTGGRFDSWIGLDHSSV